VEHGVDAVDEQRALLLEVRVTKFRSHRGIGREEEIVKVFGEVPFFGAVEGPAYVLHGTDRIRTKMPSITREARMLGMPDLSRDSFALTRGARVDKLGQTRAATWLRTPGKAATIHALPYILAQAE